MNENTKLRLELNVPTQHFVDAVERHADFISNGIEKGVNNAIEKFDFESEIEKMITDEIRDQLEWALKVHSNLGRKIKEKVYRRTQKFMKEQLKRLEDKLTNQ